jgi:hypothetical protein
MNSDDTHLRRRILSVFQALVMTGQDVLEQIRKNGQSVIFICGGSMRQRRNGFVNSNIIGACLFDLFDLVQMFKYKSA